MYPIARLVLAVTAAALLAACQTNPPQDAAAAVPKPELQFTDLQGFDKELATSLSAPLPKVDVAFYDRITPSTIPDRLQKWMSAVEAGGGKVKVQPPKSTVAAKSPFLLLSAASSVWSASRMARDMSKEAQFKAAQAYDAEIQLKIDDKGETVVDKVVFTKRP